MKGCLVFSADRLLSFTWVRLMSLEGAGCRLSQVFGVFLVVEKKVSSMFNEVCLCC